MLHRILLGVSGGIAAYKAAELTRLLIRRGMDVQVVMSKAAQQFVAPLTFEALSGKPVHSDVFGLTDGTVMGHIRLIREADAMLIAPCTADVLAKLAHGVADDLLTTLVTARGDTPVLLAPAMNPAMWHAPATQRNVDLLQQQGLRVIPPDRGDMACGEQGDGRLPTPEVLANCLGATTMPPLLHGQRWVINAGPTVEAWDAVRLLSNRASGRLGVLLATQAAMMGADVTLVAGPGVAAVPASVQRLDVVSAEEMLQACLRAGQGADVFIASAAVSDYAFAEPVAHKLKRGDVATLQVNLRSNPDIVAHVATMTARPRLVIAFAAESDAHCLHARHKLEKKGVDAIVANDIGNMGGDQAGGWWLTATGQSALTAPDKAHFSRMIVLNILELQRDFHS